VACDIAMDERLAEVKMGGGRAAGGSDCLGCVSTSRKLRMTWAPPIPGMFMSVMTRAAPYWRWSRMPSSPSSASRMECPSRSRMRRIKLR
jgi:hypothetical protein